MVKVPGEVFSHMNTQLIGQKTALFWIAWAYVAERAQNYKLADQIFQKGEDFGSYGCIIMSLCCFPLHAQVRGDGRSPRNSWPAVTNSSSAAWLDSF